MGETRNTGKTIKRSTNKKAWLTDTQNTEAPPATEVCLPFPDPLPVLDTASAPHCYSAYAAPCTQYYRPYTPPTCLLLSAGFAQGSLARRTPVRDKARAPCE